MTDAPAQTPPGEDGEAGHPTLRLGFARGMAPSKWAERWRRSTDVRLELVPLGLGFGGLDDLPPRERGTEVDVLLERTLPGERPAGAGEAGAGLDDAAADRGARHALRLYDEVVALVVPAEHELAEQEAIDAADLALVRLLDHPGHAAQWPDAEPWADPSWRPASVPAALELVATGLGAILLPLPLARHLVDKRAHALLPVVDATGASALPGSTVWATWDVARDAADVQLLAGILRGRRERSSRPGAGAGADPAGAARGDRGRSGAKQSGRQAQQKPTPKKAGPKPGSRGAQLAAAKEKAERAKAAKRKAKKRR